MFCWHDGAIRFSETHKPDLVAELPTMVLSETRSLQLSWVMRGCIGLQWRLGAEAQKSPNF
jgi:hypothetical protein